MIDIPEEEISRVASNAANQVNSKLWMKYPDAFDNEDFEKIYGEVKEEVDSILKFLITKSMTMPILRPDKKGGNDLGSSSGPSLQ